MHVDAKGNGAKIFLGVILALAAVGLAGGGVYAQDEAKLGYVDLSRLFDEYEKTKDYDKELEGRHKEYQKERTDKVTKIQELQSKLSLLREEEKPKIESEIEQMKTTLLDYDKQKETDLTKARNEKIREILLEIEKVVADYAKKENFKIILNDRVLIYGEESINVTEPVLRLLNESQDKSKKK